MWYSRIWTIMYVDLWRPKPNMWPSDCRHDERLRWVKKEILLVKAECCTKKRKGVYSDVNPSRVHGTADTCEGVCVTNSVVRKNQKGQGRERGCLMQGSREWCTLSLLFMLVKAFHCSRWPLPKQDQNPFILVGPVLGFLQFRL